MNPAPAIALSDGAVAIPDEETFTALSTVFAARGGGGGSTRVLKLVVVDADADRPLVYFMNTSKHVSHFPFLEAVGIEPGRGKRGFLTYHPELIAPDGSQGLYYFSAKGVPFFSREERFYTQLAASIGLLEDNLAIYLPNHWLAQIQDDLPLFRKSRMHVVFDEDITPPGSQFSPFSSLTVPVVHDSSAVVVHLLAALVSLLGAG